MWISSFQIPLAGDIRPYFTMQDSDHAQLVNKLPPKAGLLLGVTNPFFEKSCLHWPHVLSLGRQTPYVMFLPVSVAVTHCRNINSPRQKTSALGSAGPAPGWKTKTHRRYISKDRDLLKQLVHACYKGNDTTRNFICLSSGVLIFQLIPTQEWRLLWLSGAIFFHVQHSLSYL